MSCHCLLLEIQHSWQPGPTGAHDGHGRRRQSRRFTGVQCIDEEGMLRTGWWVSSGRPSVKCGVGIPSRTMREEVLTMGVNKRPDPSVGGRDHVGTSRCHRDSASGCAACLEVLRSCSLEGVGSCQGPLASDLFWGQSAVSTAVGTIASGAMLVWSLSGGM